MPEPQQNAYQLVSPLSFVPFSSLFALAAYPLTGTVQILSGVGGWNWVVGETGSDLCTRSYPLGQAMQPSMGALLSTLSK